MEGDTGMSDVIGSPSFRLFARPVRDTKIWDVYTRRVPIDSLMTKIRSVTPSVQTHKGRHTLLQFPLDYLEM